MYNKEVQTKYYQKHRERIIARQKKYYQANKKKIAERKAEWWQNKQLLKECSVCGKITKQGRYIKTWICDEHED